MGRHQGSRLQCPRVVSKGLGLKRRGAGKPGAFPAKQGAILSLGEVFVVGQDPCVVDSQEVAAGRVAVVARGRLGPVESCRSPGHAVGFSGQVGCHGNAWGATWSSLGSTNQWSDLLDGRPIHTATSVSLQMCEVLRGYPSLIAVMAEAIEPTGGTP